LQPPSENTATINMLIIRITNHSNDFFIIFSSLNFLFTIFTTLTFLRFAQNIKTTDVTT